MEIRVCDLLVYQVDVELVRGTGRSVFQTRCVDVRTVRFGAVIAQ